MTLPARIKRWTPRLKREVVAAVARGHLTLETAMLRYGISEQEFAEWKRGSVKAMEVVRC